MNVKVIYLKFVLFFVCYICCVFSYAESSVVMSAQHSQQSEVSEDIEGRSNFGFNSLEVSSLFGLISLIVLKILEDRFKAQVAFSKYKKILWFLVVIFGLLGVSIVFCILREYGNPRFVNINSGLSAFALFLICVITLITAKDKSNTSTLNPGDLEKKINDFTSRGTSPLKVLAGDLDFLGNVYKQSGGNKRKKGRKRVQNITESTQIKTIKDNNIAEIRIICKQPNDDDDKARIGYLLTEFAGKITIKFFDKDDSLATLLRGRIMHRDGISKKVVFITKKIIKGKEYEYSEYSADSLSGCLFIDLWETLWNFCKSDQNALDACKNIYDKRIS